MKLIFIYKLVIQYMLTLWKHFIVSVFLTVHSQLAQDMFISEVCLLRTHEDLSQCPEALLKSGYVNLR